MKEVGIDELIDSYVDIRGNYENAKIEISCNRKAFDLRPTYIVRLFHTHPYYEFFYVQTEDEIELFFEDDPPIRLKAGDICIVPPFRRHYAFRQEAAVTTQKHLLVLGFHFHENHLNTTHDFYKSLSQTFEKIDAPLIVRSTNTKFPWIQSTLFSFREAIDKGSLKSALLDFCKVLEMLVEDGRKQPPILSKSDILRKIDYLINACYMYDIKLSDVAEILFTSTRSLNRLLLDAWQSTFHSLLTEKRMLAAAAYLTHSNHSIAKVAELSGYRSLSSFYTAFKTYYGVLPAEYKAKAQRKD